MYIGIDLGTTCCKCIMFGADGVQLASYSEEFPLIANGVFVYQDAELWWEAVKRGISAVTAHSGVRQVKALSVSTQGITVVPADGHGNALHNALSWLDKRASIQVQQILEHFTTHKIRAITGLNISSSYTLPKIMWLRQNMPELFASAARFMLPLDFINFKLTGHAVSDYTIAGGSLMFDVGRKKWHGGLIELAGLSEERLPRLMPMGSFVGNILPEVAAQTGLLGQCRVILGGQDQKLAAIGGGIDANTATVSLGTASAVSVINKRVPKEYFSKFALSKDDYIYEAVSGTTGASIKWLRDIIGAIDYRRMDELAESSEDSCGIEIVPDFASGASISGLNLSHTQGNLVYALYEGIGRHLAKFIDCLDGIDSIVVYGGGAKSEVLCRVLSDEFRRKVTVSANVETAALGAAMLASEGALQPKKDTVLL